MSAVAQICKANGVTVTGSDLSEVFPTDRGLAAAGIVPFPRFRPEHLGSPDVVVVSAAYGEDNPEVAEAKRRGIPILSYPQFLGSMMQEKRGVAVTGTHGKTTTTAMIAKVLQGGGLDPQAVIGVGDAYTGHGEFLVAESCEYRRHFLNYPVEMAVVTNIELDHPDYFRSEEDYEAAFREFSAKLPPGGLLICCGDDAKACGLPTPARRVTYGRGQGSDYRLEILLADEVAAPTEGTAAAEQRGANGGGALSEAAAAATKSAPAPAGLVRYRAFRYGEDLGEFRLNVPGEHNALNSLAAVALGCELGLDPGTIRSALAEFGGVRRRFERIGEYQGATIFDDYAHHPTAIRATVRAARDTFPGRRIWALFQPHTYSRTAALLEEFASALAEADRSVLAEIFASARERGRATVSSLEVAKRIPGAVFFDTTHSFHDLVAYLKAELRPGDILLTMGAGDIYKVGYDLAGSRDLAEPDMAPLS